MSDTESDNPANRGPAPKDNGAGNGADTDTDMVSVQTYAQYVRDFSFENPGAPEFFENGEEEGTIDMHIGVDTEKIDGGVYEVGLLIRAEAGRGDKTQFLVELTYCGMFKLVNVPEDQTEEILRVNCANLLFPFARHIIADATRNGGYPPLLLNLIDFGALYRKYHDDDGELAGEAAAEDQAG
ncbi:MAG: protein-export chaperone SecB [Alphaproteobacteria bacterium]